MSIADHRILVILIQNVAFFALATVVYLQVTALVARLPAVRRQLVQGLVFGVAALLGMTFPVHLAPGVIADARTIAIALAAPFGGPLAAGVAALLAGAYRLWLGGAGAIAGVGSIAAAALVAVLFMAWLRRRRVSFGYRHLPALGLAGTVGSQVAILSVAPGSTITVLTHTVLPLVALTVIGTILFGGLLLRERQRRERDVRYQSVIDGVGEVVIEADLSGRLTYLNRAWEEVTGHPVATSLGRPLLDFVHPADRDGFLAVFSALRRGERVDCPCEVRCLSAGGAPLWVRVNARARTDERGDVLGIAGTLDDISARKAAENALRASEERLQGLLSRMRNIVFCSGERGAGPYGYRAGTRNYGADAADLTGTVVNGKADLALWYACIHPDDKPTYMELERRRRELGEPYTFDFRIKHGRTGQLRWMRETAWRVVNQVTGQVYFDSYIIDITTEKETAERLRRLVAEADSANRAKSHFLAAMSHEIRTPLNAIIGFSDVLQHELFGPIGSAQYRGYAKDINDSGVHLLQLINDILDLSKIEAGKLELHLEDVNAGEMVRACLRLVGERARAGGVALKAEVAPALPPLNADARSVKQIMLNLLSNAVKFTPAGGEVRVALERDAEGFVFRVADTGIGIAARDMPKAMAAFGQVDNVFSRKHEGTGLGLPLVRALVEAHGGRFTLDSEVGVGTTATVWLPRRQALRAA